MAQYKYGETIQLHVGGYLKHGLKCMGITQEEFAYRVNYSPREVRRWISSGVNGLDKLDVIAGFFKVSAWDILSGEGDVPSPHLSVIMKFNMRNPLGHSLT